MAVPEDRLFVVADSFLNELNALLLEWGVETSDGGGQVEAELNFLAEYDLAVLSNLHIDVQVLSLEEDIEDRSNNPVNRYGFNVVVQKAVSGEAATPVVIDGYLSTSVSEGDDVNAKIRDLCQLTVAIFRHWQKGHVVNDLTSVELEEKNLFLYSPDLLIEAGKFVGAAMFIFREATK